MSGATERQLSANDKLQTREDHRTANGGMV